MPRGKAKYDLIPPKSKRLSASKSKGDESVPKKNPEKLFGKSLEYVKSLLRSAIKTHGNESQAAQAIGIDQSAVNRIMSEERGVGIQFRTVLKIVADCGGDMELLARLYDEDEAAEIFKIAKEEQDAAKMFTDLAKRGGPDWEKLKQDMQWLLEHRTHTKK
jgi:plasmid maintenance system antidote protein VapI